MIARALVLSSMITAAGLIAARGSGPESAAPRQELAAFPTAVGIWTATGDVPIDAATREILRADEYVDRTYRDPSGRLLDFYVAYYGSQRQGATIHSPQHCLPGSGWQPVESGTGTLRLGDRTVAVNRWVIERQGVRQLVYYWYQGRGRLVTNDFANKFWLIVDAARLRRSDGALVRVMTSMDTSSAATADAASTDFSRSLFPILARFVP